MNPTAAQTLEEVTGLMLLPLPVAAQLLGISTVTARRQLPLVRVGHRTVCITVADIRQWIASKQQTQVTPPTTNLKIIRK
jgi:hypothetical protein